MSQCDRYSINEENLRISPAIFQKFYLVKIDKNDDVNNTYDAD